MEQNSAPKYLEGKASAMMRIFVSPKIFELYRGFAYEGSRVDTTNPDSRLKSV